MSIWNGSITIQLLNDLMKNTLGDHLKISFTEVGEDFLKATMPVSPITMQPFGLLHGGASVALAETLGSVASWCLIKRDIFMGVGIEINANHVRPVASGMVTCVCSPIKASGKIHTWEIKILDDNGELCCISRFTCMIVPLRK